MTRTWKRLGRAATVTLLMATLAGGPVLAADSDGDGLKDWFERKWGVTDPDRRDSDGDGVVDSAEDSDGDRLGNLGEQRFGTDPGNRDTDGDGRSDGREDHDRDGRSNAREQDQRPIPAGVKPSLHHAADDRTKYRFGCNSQLGKEELVFCEFGKLDSPVTLVLMGDSHAMMWLPAVKRTSELEGWKLLTLFKGSCPPILGIRVGRQYETDRNRTCRRWRYHAMDWLNAHPPDLVMLAHADSYKLMTAKGTLVQPARKPDIWKAGLEYTLAGMPAASRTVLFGDVPANRANPVACLKGSRSDMSRCVSWYEPKYRRYVEKALREGTAAEPNAAFRTLYGRICTYDPCPLVQGDVLMWRDRGHLSATFAKRLTPSMRAILTDVMPASAARRR